MSDDKLLNDAGGCVSPYLYKNTGPESKTSIEMTRIFDVKGPIGS